MNLKKGFPEESELLLCTVTSVQHHSVFVKIEEYGIVGMIHISEVSPGRIRNIRDYVVEGKSVITKVLRVNPERGHVDLSLRRVSESQRRNKNNEIKKEKMALKLIEVVAGNLKEDPKKIYKTVSSRISQHYYLMFECLSDVSKGTFDIKKLKLPPKISQELQKVVSDRLKPEFFRSKGTLRLSTSQPDGVKDIRDALKKASGMGAEVKYFGGGLYSLTATASSYKNAESMIAKAAKSALSFIESKNGEGSFSEKE